jgi:hypothetical protein
VDESVNRAARPGRFFRVALAFFAATALAGLAFAVQGPVAAMRMLGLVALTLSALGCALEVYALRVFDPAGYVALKRRAKETGRELGLRAKAASRSGARDSRAPAYRVAASPALLA